MIYVTQRDNKQVLLNNDLIEIVEETPDTVITLVTGKKILVKESTEEIRQRVAVFKAKVINMSYKKEEETE